MVSDYGGNLGGTDTVSRSHTHWVPARQSHAVLLEQTLEFPRQTTALAISCGNKIDAIRPTPLPQGAHSCSESLMWALLA